MEFFVTKLLYLVMWGASQIMPINLQDAVSGVQLVGVTGWTSFQHVLDEDASHRGRTEATAICWNWIDFPTNDGDAQTLAGHPNNFDKTLGTPMLRTKRVWAVFLVVVVLFFRLFVFFLDDVFKVFYFFIFSRRSSQLNSSPQRRDWRLRLSCKKIVGTDGRWRCFGGTGRNNGELQWRHKWWRGWKRKIIWICWAFSDWPTANVDGAAALAVTRRWTCHGVWIRWDERRIGRRTGRAAADGDDCGCRSVSFLFRARSCGHRRACGRLRLKQFDIKIVIANLFAAKAYSVAFQT